MSKFRIFFVGDEKRKLHATFRWLEMRLLNFNITNKKDSYYVIRHALQVSLHLPPLYVYCFLALDFPIITICEVPLSSIFKI